MSALVGLVYGALPGCDAQQETAETVATEQQTPAGDVEKRAQGRWKQLLDGDFQAAYGYETPGYRETSPYQQYRAQFGSAVRWLNATVTGVEISDSAPERAVVKVRLDYEGPAPGGGTYVGSRALSETWLLTDGQWWHVRD